MSMDWERLAEETLAVLEQDGRELMENIDDTQRKIMVKAVQDLAKAELDIIRGKDVETNTENIKFIHSTLATEADLARYKASEKLKKAFMSALNRVVMPALLALI